MTDQLSIDHRCVVCGHGLQPPAPHAACTACGTAWNFLNGIPSLVPEIYDQVMSKEFDQAAEQGQNKSAAVGCRSEAHHLHLSQAVADCLGPLAEGGLLLDVGCGHGNLSKQLVGRHRVVGVDFSLNMLSMAASNGLHVYHADALNMPFADEQFDAVLCTEVLQLFKDPTMLINELARVLRPEGLLLLSTLNSQCLARKAYRAAKALLPGRSHINKESMPHMPIMRSAADLREAMRGFPFSNLKTGAIIYPSGEFASHGPAPWLLGLTLFSVWRKGAQ